MINPMLIRQKVILSLIDQMDGQITRLSLVKLAFLLGNEINIKTYYQFVPYHYGPFSFTLYHELETLKRNGYLLHPSKDEIQRVNDVAFPPVDLGLRSKISDFLKKYQGLPAVELVNHVYSGFPWFTINAKASENRKEERPKGGCAVYTAGYEGLQIDGFLNILLKAGIQQVIDVRHNPISRRYGFHKSTLSRLCKRLTITYKHVPEVGIPSELRSSLHPSDYIQLFQNYEQDILLTQQAAVENIARWVKSKPSVLVCMEANPGYCHRSRLAKQIANRTGLMIHHLGVDSCKPATPEQRF